MLEDICYTSVQQVVAPLGATPQGVKKVDVDDWAWKRGHRYGTLVCDLERGISIDLLPDRTMEMVTAWFQLHPGVGLIGRDRASEYAVAASKGCFVLAGTHTFIPYSEAFLILTRPSTRTGRKQPQRS